MCSQRMSWRSCGAESLLLFDQALSGRESAARARLNQGWRAIARRYRPRADAGGVGGPPRAVAPRSRAPGADGRLHGLPAPVRPGRAGRRPVRGRPRHGRPAAGRRDPGRAVRDEGPQGPGRSAGRVCAGPVGRVPRECAEGRRRHRLPALLGAVRADGPARRPAIGRCLRPGVAPVRRPVLFLALPAAVGAAAAGVLPRRRQARVGCRRPGPGERRVACGPVGPGGPARPGRRSGRGPADRGR